MTMTTGDDTPAAPPPRRRRRPRRRMLQGGAVVVAVVAIALPIGLSGNTPPAPGPANPTLTTLGERDEPDTGSEGRAGDRPEPGSEPTAEPVASSAPSPADPDLLPPDPLPAGSTAEALAVPNDELPPLDLLPPEPGPGVRAPVASGGPPASSAAAPAPLPPIPPVPPAPMPAAPPPAPPIPAAPIPAAPIPAAPIPAAPIPAAPIPAAASEVVASPAGPASATPTSTPSSITSTSTPTSTPTSAVTSTPTSAAPTTTVAERPVDRATLGSKRAVRLDRPDRPTAPTRSEDTVWNGTSAPATTPGTVPPAPDRPTARPTGPTASATPTTRPAAPSGIAVAAGTLDDLPRGGLTAGTPVVVTGNDLPRAEYWTVGGRRVPTHAVTARRLVLVVPPGQASGDVAWHMGTATGGIATNLAKSVPAMTEARPVIWGAGCATPAQTGLVWINGRAGGDVALTSGTGEREIGDRTLRNGSVLATVGESTPGSVVVRRGAWITNIPVGGGPVDVTQLASLPRLAGNDCPNSAGTSMAALIEVGSVQVRKVTTVDGTPRFVAVSDNAVLVLLPRGITKGTQTVSVEGKDGKVHRFPMKMVMPYGAVTLLADQMVRRSP